MAGAVSRCKANLKISDEAVQGLIRKRAQELCQKRGCVSGNDWADWFEAEKQIKRELHKSD